MTYILRHIDDDMWRQIKSKAALEGITIRVLMQRLLADYLKAK